MRGEFSKKAKEIIYEVFKEKGISDRQIQVTILTMQGWKREEISKRLKITVPTVNSHLHFTYKLLNVSRKVDLFWIVDEAIKKRDSVTFKVEERTKEGEGESVELQSLSLGDAIVGGHV